MSAMTCDEWNRKICCRPVPCFQLVSFWSIDFHLVFWVTSYLVDEGRCSGTLTSYTQPDLRNGTSTLIATMHCNVTMKCFPKIAFRFVHLDFTVPFTFCALRIQIIWLCCCVLSLFPAAFLLVTTVVTPYGLAPTVSVTSHECYLSTTVPFRWIQLPGYRVAGPTPPHVFWLNKRTPFSRSGVTKPRLASHMRLFDI
jgi:hypothetical protein